MITNFHTLINVYLFIWLLIWSATCDTHMFWYTDDIHVILIWNAVFYIHHVLYLRLIVLFPSIYYIHRTIFTLMFSLFDSSEWYVCITQKYRVNTISTSSRSNNMADSAQRLQNRITTPFYTTLMNILI